jgi:hypothetical protein
MSEMLCISEHAQEHASGFSWDLRLHANLVSPAVLDESIIFEWLVSLGGGDEKTKRIFYK